MDFSNVKQDIIKEILVGPKSDVTVEDIVNLLAFYGYYCREEGYNENAPIPITLSASSYR